MSAFGRPGIFIAILLLASNGAAAQGNQFDPGKTYQPDSLRRWTKSVFLEISRKHPGFYRYTTKDRFDTIIDSTIQTINVPLTELEYYRKIKPMFAQIGCLHTGVTLSKKYQNHLDSTRTLVPIEIFIDSNRNALIVKNHDTKTDLPTGGQIVSINQVSISTILNSLLKAIPSDGFNQTEKVLLLNHRFSFWYQTIIEVTETFSVEVQIDGITRTYELKGVSKEVFPTLKSLETNYPKPLEFEIQGKTGFLKVHSFAKTTMRTHDQKFKKYIKNTFKRINESDVERLVIDVRYNAGGTDGNAALLASYFFDQPFRYWDRIEVTEALAAEIKGFKRLFYKKPKEVNGTYRWGKTWLTNEFDYYQIQKPARNNYKGESYVLTNGLCLSSCSDFVAILSQNKRATVIGQETGGGFQGNTSGMIPEATLQTGLRISIPLQKYVNAVDPARNFGRGTIPDFEIAPTFEDWVNKRDVEMEFVMKLINDK